MGHLIEGKWKNDEVATTDEKGKFDREESTFRSRVGVDEKVYKPEEGRYHLYVSYACPWAHRTLIARKLKGLEGVISLDVVHPNMLEHSWTFSNDFKGSTGDSLYSNKYLYEIYQKHDPKVSTKVTVPILWDKKSESIVNNESSEILRILNSGFGDLAKNNIDLYPSELSDKIDEMNKLTYEPINNGVYKTGFAKNQKAYEEAFDELFQALEKIESHLEGREHLVGDRLTEADIRLVTTLIRFDVVYHGHFKCNLKRISDFKNLSRYLKKMYDLDAVKSTSYIDHIKQHYHYSHETINPYRIVPKGPSDELLFI
jgi:putative glutathione S-transferase